MRSLSTIGIVLLLFFIFAVIAFYGYRLARTQKTGETTDERLRALMDQRRGATDSPAPTVAANQRASMTLPWVRDRAGAQELDPSVVGQVRRYDGAPGLRSLSEQPIFLRKDSAGDVIFQVEEKRATPIKYVLDPRIRQVLGQVAQQADRDFGKTWAVLASEDTEGKLMITRLL
jgi:hypothetical protein